MDSIPPPISLPAQPAVPSRGNDKIWSMFCHLSVFLGIGFLLVPLVVYLAMRHESEYVAANAREALNFHISVLIYFLCCIPLCFVIIGFFFAAVVGISDVRFVHHRHDQGLGWRLLPLSTDAASNTIAEIRSVNASRWHRTLGRWRSPPNRSCARGMSHWSAWDRADAPDSKRHPGFPHSRPPFASGLGWRRIAF